jgi:hypothetical protein
VVPRLFAPVPEIAPAQHWKPYLREREPDRRPEREPDLSLLPKTDA